MQRTQRKPCVRPLLLASFLVISFWLVLNLRLTSHISTNPSKEAKPKFYLHVVTYASHIGRDVWFCYTIESAIRHGIQLTVLGWDTEWKGLSQKLQAAYDYSSSIPSNDIILFVDAYDVMFTNTAQYILNEYLRIGADMLFAAECGCWPHILLDNSTETSDCFRKYPLSPTPYRYLNSGTWIGRAHAAREVLFAVINESGSVFNQSNDQKLVADMFLNRRYGIRLDVFSRIFQSMHASIDHPSLPYCNPYENVDFSSLRFGVKNNLTNSYPAVVHFNGGGKRYRVYYEDSIWYRRDKQKYQSDYHLSSLRKQILFVPHQGNPLRTVEFQEMCPLYFPNGYSEDWSLRGQIRRIYESIRSVKIF